MPPDPRPPYPSEMSVAAINRAAAALERIATALEKPTTIEQSLQTLAERLFNAGGGA